MFLGYFLGGLVVFVTLFVAVDFVSAMVRFSASTKAMFEYYTFYTPWIVAQLIPVACLMGTVFTLSSLNKSNELVALFSSGMSLARVSSSILILVVFISGVSFWIGDRVLPFTNQKKNYVYFVDIKKQPGLYSTVKTNKIWYRTSNVLYNIKTLKAEKGIAQGLMMYYFDENWKLMQLISAEEVSMQGPLWQLNKGSVTMFSKVTQLPVTQAFKKKSINMGQDAADLQSTAQSSQVLSVGELKRFIQRNKEAGLDTVQYEVDYQSKFSFAFAAVVMSFIGIPFSVTKQRSGGAAINIGVCIALTFFYYVFYHSGLTLGKQGLVPPLMAAWIPNLVGLMVSLILLVRLKK